MRYDIDPVVEEIRKTRRQLFARCGYDPHEYGKFLQAASLRRRARLRKRASSRRPATPH
jgi:hypothetical protein